MRDGPMTTEQTPDDPRANRPSRIPLQGGGYLEQGSIFEISKNADAFYNFYNMTAHLPQDTPKPAARWIAGAGAKNWKLN